MPFVDTVRELLTFDPFLAYSLLASVVLAGVALWSGFAKLDFVALFRPSGFLQIGAAVALAVALLVAARNAGILLGTIDPSSPFGFLRSLSDAGPHPYWPLGGLERLPLYVVAIAYGPSAGLLAGGFFAAFATDGQHLGAYEAVLVLELTVLGWLAILPSAFVQRAAGPANALGAYVLAWGTAGLAALHVATGSVTVAGLWVQHSAQAGGALLAAALLFLVSPDAYARWFRHSRIAPLEPLRRQDDPVPVRALDSSRAPREPEAYLPPPLPELKRVRRKRTELEPPPDLPDTDLRTN